MANSAKEKIAEKFSESKSFINKVSERVPDYLKDRIVPALIMIPLAIFFIYASKNLFALLVLACAILMAFEWNTITQLEFQNRKWQIAGLFYILVPCFSLLYLRGLEKGSDIILWLFLVVWATDIGGLVVGKTIGGPKLAPSISPNKTWAGLGGGILASMLIGLICSVIFKESAIFFIVFSGLIAILEQISDLLESKVKRIFDVKDSGDIIPGHGGILDRVDGLILTTPLIALIATITSHIF